MNIKMNEYPYLKNEFSVKIIKGKLQIIDESTDKISLPPVNIDSKVYPIIVQFNGNRTIAQICKSVENIINRDATIIVNKLCTLLIDRIEFHSDNTKTRDIFDVNIATELKTLTPVRSEKHTLKQLNFAIEPTCAFSCIYCLANAKHTVENRDYLSLQDWERITKDAKDLGCQVVFYGGGDPVRKQNLEEYMEISSKNGLISRMSTRSRISYERMKKFVESGLDMLQLSFDSYDEKTVDFLAGQKGTFKGLVETAKYAKEFNIEMHARSVLTRYNIDHYEKWAELMIQLEFNKIISGIVFSSCGKDVTHLFPNETQIRNLEKMVYDIKKKYETNEREIYFDNHYTQLFGKPLTYLTAHRHKCNGSTTILNFSHNGTVYFCDTLIGHDNAAIGDLRKMSLKEILDSDLLRRMRYPEREDYIGTECEKCKMFDKCADKRCYMRSMLAYGSMFQKDPWCSKGEALPFYCPI